MSRPAVSVVMPFAGDRTAAQTALDALGAIETATGDQLILVDNSPEAAAGGGDAITGGGDAITIIRAAGEHSPAYARNAGAAHASAPWILFLDADCRPAPDLLASYYAAPVDEEVGALVGELVPAQADRHLISQYLAARHFLGQEAHMTHPYRPRAAAANLLVRRRAFEDVGGFLEGVRAAEDTDFSWRLQQAGWRLEQRAGAWAEHNYRQSLAGLRRRWRGYAAGRAWLARRYEGFRPEPAVVRLVRQRGRRTNGSGSCSERRQRGNGSRQRGKPLRHAGFLVIDGLLAVEELAGFALSNRPVRDRPGRPAVVLLAESFPARGDPLVELASAVEGARVEALRRPPLIGSAHTVRFTIDYLEDDGLAQRAGALIWTLAHHPLRSALDRANRRPGRPPLVVLAPAVRRLAADPSARVLALGSSVETRSLADRIAWLAGRRLDEMPGSLGR